MEIPQRNILSQYNLQSLAGLAVILVLTLFLYYPLAGFGWITGLDQVLVIDNSMIYHLNQNNVLEMFLSTTAGRYQPLAFLSYSLDIFLAPASVIKTMHIVNLILHLLNILLFFRIMQLLTKKQIIIFSAALLFAIHPMNVETLAWISSRSQLLCAFFFLSAVLSYIYYTRHDTSRSLYFLCTVFFIMALFSNPVAVIFPIVLMLIDYLQNKNLKDALNGKIFFFILSIIFVIITVLTFAEPEITVTSPGVFENIVLAGYSVILVFSKFLLPVGIAAYHPFPEQIMMWPVILASLAVIFFVTVFWFFRKEKTYISGLLFFLAGILAAFLLRPEGHYLYSENETYLPYLGLYGLAGLAFYRLYGLLRHKKIFLIAALIVVSAWMLWLGKTSIDRLADWHDSGRTWSRVITLYPDDHYAYFLRGDYWAMNGDFDKAKFDYNQCIRKNDRAYQAFNNLGLIYLGEKAPMLALDEFNRAIEINSTFYKAYLNKGLTYMRIGRNDLAMENMNMAVELNPDEPLAYFNRALIYERKDAFEKAIAEYTKAIRLDPYRFTFYKNRGKAYVFKQRFPNAELDYSKALDLDPSNAEMWFRRSLVRVSQDNFKGGLQDAFMAQKLGYPVEEEYIKGLAVQILEADSVILE